MTMTATPVAGARGDDPVDPKLLTQMKKLIAKEEASLFQQGWLLAKYEPTPAQWAELAQKLQRKISTLKERREVGLAFPEGTIDPRYAWSVYRALLRIKNHDERLALLNSRDEWSKDEIFLAARQAEQEETEAIDPDVRATTRRGMKIGGIGIVGEMVGENVVQITIESPLLEVDPHPLPGKYILVCKVAG